MPIRVKELPVFEPVILKANEFLLALLIFFKSIFLRNRCGVIQGDFSGKRIISEGKSTPGNRLSKKEMWCGADKHNWPEFSKMD